MMAASAAPAPSRRTTRRELRRDAILDVARRSFLERGYAATTMSGIAATLGGSKATLWSYFPSKDALFAAVLDRATQEFRKELSLLLNPDDGIAATLRRFCRQFLGKVTLPEAIALHRLVAAEARRFPEVGEIFFKRAPGQTRDQLARFLSDAMARGQLRPADPRIAAQQLIGMCLAGCHMLLLVGAIDNSTRDMVERDADEAVDTFLRGYGEP